MLTCKFLVNVGDISQPFNSTQKSTGHVQVGRTQGSLNQGEPTELQAYWLMVGSDLADGCFEEAGRNVIIERQKAPVLGDSECLTPYALSLFAPKAWFSLPICLMWILYDCQYTILE